MIELSSENIDILEFIENQSYSNVTFDIETLDSKPLNLLKEPIVSFSLSFVPDISLPLLTYFPTFAFIITDTSEEKELLLKLKEIFLKIPNVIIIGHNVSYELDSKKECVEVRDICHPLLLIGRMS
ncbi:MAG: hypothetical protein ACUVXA_20765, partial [Candidatus Jordarchaeum sp.]|uniref:hypothetical protein n=1 Tax=Candidatus Jordarchaeum sp. TaxID=2823881 RepID=UPI004048ECCE